MPTWLEHETGRSGAARGGVPQAERLHGCITGHSRPARECPEHASRALVCARSEHESGCSRAARRGVPQAERWHGCITGHSRAGCFSVVCCACMHRNRCLHVFPIGPVWRSAYCAVGATSTRMPSAAGATGTQLMSHFPRTLLQAFSIVSECAGCSLCEHRGLRSEYKECGCSSICEHKRSGADVGLQGAQQRHLG